MAFYKYLKSHAEKQPDSAAIIEGDSTVTYSEFCKQVESFAAALSELPLNSIRKNILLPFLVLY